MPLNLFPFHLHHYCHKVKKLYSRRYLEVVTTFPLEISETLLSMMMYFSFPWMETLASLPVTLDWHSFISFLSDGL